MSQPLARIVRTALLLAVLAWQTGEVRAQPPAATPRIVTIGTVSGQIGPNGADNAATFSGYLEERIPGYGFEVVPYDTIERMIAAVDADQVDFAFITPVAYVQLGQRHLLRPLATVTQQVSGQMYPWLASSVFVRADREDLQTLDDARNQNVMALSPLALGGWLAALREWRLLGIRETEDFASLQFNFSYADIVQAVCDGSADVGVLGTSVFLAGRSDCAEPLRVLMPGNAVSDPRFPLEVSSRIYPEVAFALVGVVEERLVNQLTLALLGIQQGSDAALAINVAGFTAPLGYDSVTVLMQELQLEPFESYGEISLLQVLLQHRGKLSLLMFLVAGVLVLAWVRNVLLERKVQQSELFRSRIFSRSQFGVVIVDARTLEFVDVNTAAVRLFGYNSRDELLRRSPLLVMAAVQQDGRPVGEMIDRVRASLRQEDAPLIMDWLLRRPSAELWEAEAHMVPFMYGNDYFIQITLVDVTERKRILKESERMEQQLRHAQRLESIGRFSGAIAHDFNNLLTVINGYSELLLLNHNHDDNKRNIYKEISLACSRAGELTNQLLTFSRRRITRMEPLDVNHIITDSASMFRRLLGETVTMATSLGADPALTLADSGQLHQVLMNFVVNARDAMPDGGEFSIATDTCTVDETLERQLNVEQGQYIRIQVRDTGTGMSKEVQDKIFEPFFTTKGDRGTGFGLATAYGIVRQCRGAITFQSELGQGTTFTLYLPQTDQLPKLPTLQVLQPVPVSSGSRTVLVVEDEREVRIFACLLLQTAGFRVLEADSGTSALALAQRHDGVIDLLFTDVVLGDISGTKLAEKFKHHFPVTPVLFTSGYANDEIALHGVMQDRIAFIAKPYSPATLLAKIRTLFAQSIEPA